MTNAGMMDCKKALTESNGDFDAAVKWLRERGMAQASKRSARIAAEGAVASYIHLGGKVGVLVEINCETDFAAHSEPFQTLCKEICFQICAASPQWVSRDEVPQSAIAAEKEVYMARAREMGKPEAVLAKIADGMMAKYFEEVCLLEQPSIRDKDRKVEEIVKETSGRLGEKIEIRRFTRFQLGEGIDKPQSDFAEEVAKSVAEAQGN